VIIWKRLLRTLTSERFIASRGKDDVAAVDLHYLASGHVSGTVFLFKAAGWQEADVADVLRSLDETMLPEVDLASGSLTYTVVHGDVWGNFEASAQPPQP
jgi:hypothetical protein